MTDNAKPIRSESARFLVGGTRKGQGVVLLYPDKLASVKTRAELCGYFVGPVAAFPIIHTIGAWPGVAGALHGAIGILLGGVIGRAVDRRLAVKAVADGPKTATIIPLDMVTGLRSDRSAGFAGWFITETLVVTTADGTQYGFRGRTGHLQNDITGALARLGREVLATTAGLTVTPQALG